MAHQVELTLSEENRVTAARSKFYKILSGMFFYPAEGRQGALGPETESALREVASELPYVVPAVALLQLADTAWPEGSEGAAVTYTSLFDNCTGRPAISLHEKDYSRNDAKQIWEELIRYYEHFGLSYTVAESKEWPDHIGIQLEFLHYLTFLEAGASDQQADVYVTAENDFLERHLAEWVPQFSKKLGSMAQGTPYEMLAQVLAEFIQGETEFNKRRRTLQ